MKDMQKKEWKSAVCAYIPAMITVAIGIVTLVLYALFSPQKTVVTYLMIPGITVVPFILIFLNRKLGLGVPAPVFSLICLHFIWSVHVGTAMGMYKILPWWDLLVHGFFGTLGCAVIYYMFIKFEGKKPRPVNYLIIILAVIGLAGLWEIFEFVCDLILHNDVQNVQSAIARGANPLTDTMTDIIIAIAGALIFYAILIVRHIIGVKKSGETRPRESLKGGDEIQTAQEREEE